MIETVNPRVAKDRPAILVVEDLDWRWEEVRGMLIGSPVISGFDLVRATTADDARRVLDDREVRVMLLDYDLDRDGAVKGAGTGEDVARYAPAKGFPPLTLVTSKSEENGARLVRRIVECQRDSLAIWTPLMRDLHGCPSFHSSAKRTHQGALLLVTMIAASMAGVLPFVFFDPEASGLPTPVEGGN